MRVVYVNCAEELIATPAVLTSRTKAAKSVATQNRNKVHSKVYHQAVALAFKRGDTKDKAKLIVTI